MRQPVETQLQNYFEQIEETHGSLSTNAILERAAPVQVVPNSRPVTPPPRLVRRWAWAVALIVFAGVAIFLGAIDSDAPPIVDQPVTTTVPGTLPATPPAPSGSGTLDTPLGVAEWWMVSGADGALPDNGGWVFETPTGYEMVAGPFGEGIEYWVSPDGRTWEPAPLPEGLSGLEAATRVDRRQVGATNWLVSDNTTQVWRLEGETWTSVPLPAGLGAYELGGVRDDQVWLTSTSPLGIWRLDGENWTSFDPVIGPADVGPGGFIGGQAVGGNEVVVVPWAADTLTVIDSGDVATAVTPPWASEIGQANGAQPDELTVLAGDVGL
ncbi:MAG: hypothetical protein M3P87_07170, partial [Actinomycetota bacterium]|nr:hypothetical protein [Actinomycetota bacterium]